MQEALPDVSPELMLAGLNYWEEHKAEIEAETDEDLAAFNRLPSGI